MDPHAMNTGMAGVYLVFAFIGFSVIAFIRGFMRRPPRPDLPHPDLLAATVSCSGTEITIQCNDHDVRDRLMDFLTGEVRGRHTPAETARPAGRWTLEGEALAGHDPQTDHPGPS
jgi:hypothetical protein